MRLAIISNVSFSVSAYNRFSSVRSSVLSSSCCYDGCFVISCYFNRIKLFLSSIRFIISCAGAEDSLSAAGVIGGCSGGLKSIGHFYMAPGLSGEWFVAGLNRPTLFVMTKAWWPAGRSSRGEQKNGFVTESLSASQSDYFSESWRGCYRAVSGFDPS